MMKFCCNLILLATAVFAQESNLRGQGQQDERRAPELDMSENQIVGGSIVANSNRKYPFFVHTGQCGGSLVAPDVVLCAAHCYSTIRTSVLAGAVNYWFPDVGDAERLDVVSKERHPRYNSNNQDYDIMLIKIKPVTHSHIKPVRLNISNGLPGTGQKLTVVGMGAINKEGNKYEPHLRMVDVKAQSHSSCNSKYGFINQNSMLCAGKSGKDSCYGDSGGPLVTMGGVQVGVVSFGADCADPYYPGVYARVSGAMSWLGPKICQLTDRAGGMPDPKWCSQKKYNGSSSSSSSKPSSNTLTFVATVKYDRKPQHTGWSISQGGNTIVSMKPGSYRKRNGLLRKSIKLQRCKSYTLKLWDSKNNGFTAGRRGSITITGRRGNKAVFRKWVSGKFRAMKLAKFTIPCGV